MRACSGDPAGTTVSVMRAIHRSGRTRYPIPAALRRINSGSREKLLPVRNHSVTAVIRQAAGAAYRRRGRNAADSKTPKKTKMKNGNCAGRNRQSTAHTAAPVATV